MNCRRVSLVLSLSLVMSILLGCSPPETDALESPATELESDPSGSDDQVLDGEKPTPQYRLGTPVPADYRLSGGDDGTSIELTVGQQFLIGLRGKTTYTYRVIEMDEAVIKQVGGISWQEGFSRPLFRFEGVAPGQTDLVLNYGPKGASDKNSLTIHIAVR